MRNCIYNQRDSGLEDVKRTLWNIYADNLAPSSSHGKSVVGHGVAMHAQGDFSRAQCFICSGYGHYRSDCSRCNDKKKRGHNGGKPHMKKKCRSGGNKVAVDVQLAVDIEGGVDGSPCTTPSATSTKSVSCKR